MPEYWTCFSSSFVLLLRLLGLYLTNIVSSQIDFEVARRVFDDPRTKDDFRTYIRRTTIRLRERVEAELKSPSGDESKGAGIKKRKAVADATELPKHSKRHKTLPVPASQEEDKLRGPGTTKKSSVKAYLQTLPTDNVHATGDNGVKADEETLLVKLKAPGINNIKPTSKSAATSKSATTGKGESVATGETKSAATGEGERAATREGENAATREGESAVTGEGESAATGETESAATGEGKSAATSESAATRSTLLPTTGTSDASTNHGNSGSAPSTSWFGK